MAQVRAGERRGGGAEERRSGGAEGKGDGGFGSDVLETLRQYSSMIRVILLGCRFFYRQLIIKEQVTWSH